MGNEFRDVHATSHTYKRNVIGVVVIMALVDDWRRHQVIRRRWLRRCNGVNGDLPGGAVRP